MPGMKIIEVALGLTFLYLLLSLLCTAINEYIAGILNKRGRELFKAVDQLIGDPAVRELFYKHPLIETLNPPKKRWTWRLFRWMKPSMRAHRRPSYMPARNFALALLSSIDYPLARRLLSPGSTPAVTPPNLTQLFDTLMQESATDVSTLLKDPAVASILGSRFVPPSVSAAITGAVIGAERDLQKLQNAVEVWFNNAMDRVSGTYKRYTQIALLLIGLVVSASFNADTLQIGKKLSTDPQFRNSVVQQAIAFNEAHRPHQSPAGGSSTSTNSTVSTDSTARDSAGRRTGGGAPPTDTTAQDTASCAPVTGEAAKTAFDKALAGQPLTCGEAAAVLAVERATLDESAFGLGWTDAELVTLGVAKQGADGRLKPLIWPGYWHRSIWPKLLGLLLTALAVSLGAPFWFDMLNKIVNIRAAGRAPDERAKNPETGGKRLAEVAPK